MFKALFLACVSEHVLRKVPGPKEKEQGVKEPPTFIEPSFDLKQIKKTLMDHQFSDARKKKVLLGLHVKFWHASAQDMESMFYRGGYTTAVNELADSVVKGCKGCAAYARSMPRPQRKAQLTQHFNDCAQTDLFFIFDRIFVILIDECLRWTIVDELPSKTPES